jgi:RHS repeat-associated protein
MKSITTWLTIVILAGMSIEAQARYYDPQEGRFITPDPVLQSPYDPQTLNRYAYCRNNPLIYTDPSGHSFFSDIFHGNPLDLALRAINPIAWITSTPMGWSFTAAHPQEMAAVGLGIATAGVGSIASGAGYGFLSGTADAALQGEIMGGSLSEATGGNAFTGAWQGGLQAGLTYGIDKGPFNGLERVGIKGALGGGMATLDGGSFTRGYAYSAAFASLEEGYRYYAGQAAAGSGGKELPLDNDGAHSYQPNALGQPPDGNDVSGYNRAANYPGECVQGSVCGMRINSFPGGRATSVFHDTWMNRVELGGNTVGYWTNKLSMMPAALASGTALLGTDWSTAVQYFPGVKR